jgi:hypothetical protein
MPGSTRAASSVCRSIFFSKGLQGGDDIKFSPENAGKIYKFSIPVLESGSVLTTCGSGFGSG